MKILGIDVCTGFCSVAVIGGDETLAMKHEAMTRGHAERLAPMVAEVLDEASLSATALNGIAVTTGPGSFTGARLGVSFARGLALAASIPVVGVSLFEAMAQSGTGVIVITGKQGTLLVQRFSEYATSGDPVEITAAEAWTVAPDAGDFALIGDGTDDFLENAPEAIKTRAQRIEHEPVSSQTIASIGAGKLATGSAPLPAPLYLRAPDAKPQAAIVLN